MNTLSVCMIVKNEEEVLARAVASVRNIASEIVIVDTGSTDATVSIAQALGAVISRFTWCDDFAAARNFSLSLATGDWILVLDADEILDADAEAVLQKLTDNPKRAYQLTQRHYSTDSRVHGFTPCQGIRPGYERNFPGYFETSCVRLFPRDPRIRFVGRVHELVEPAISALEDYETEDSRLVLHHYGHVRGVQRDREKRALYSALAIKKSDEGNSRWRALYELGVEQIGAGELASAIKALEESARLYPQFTMTWVNLGYALCEDQRFEHARRALLRALSIEPSSVEALCNLGVVFMRTQRFDEAAKSFSAALQYNSAYLPAWSNLGKVHLVAGRVSEAGACFTRAFELNPLLPETRTDLGQVYLMAGALAEAQRYLHAALECDPNQFRAHYLLAQIHSAQGNTSQACLHLRDLCKVLEAKGGLSNVAEQKIHEEARKELNRLSTAS